jgi:adenine-specific DNA-methyltransferase
VLDYLLKTGVKGTLKDQRISFDRLESFAGSYLHARGEYTDGEGKPRRVAVVIGPEHGMVDPDLVRRAMTEARSGVLYDLLLVLGFAFDPMVQEVARKVGDMTVLPVRMNSELLMPELKNTGAGNLFMVFGEPDVKVEKLANGQLQVEVLGLDVYNPITGEIRSDKPDDIRCWFIDTNYNDEAFFVRQAYFPGDPSAYEKLRKALKAEVDQGAWAALNTTRSRPFDAPKTGKIAVKLINDFGDEVLKVFQV